MFVKLTEMPDDHTNLYSEATIASYTSNNTNSHLDYIINRNVSSSSTSMTEQETWNSNPKPQQPFTELAGVVIVLHDVLTPCLALASILGNCICIAVLLRRRLSSLSTSHYFIAIMTSEVIHMGTLLHTWINDYKMYTNTYSIAGWCQFVTMVQNATDFLAGWFVLTLILDRFISCWFTNFECHWCTPLKAKMIIVTSAIAAIIIFLNTSMIHGEYRITGKIYCLALPGYEHEHNMLHITSAFVNVILVYGCTAVLTIFTVVKCLFQRRDRCRHPVRLTARSVSAMLKQSVNDNNEAQSQIIVFCVFILCFLISGTPQQGIDLSFAINNFVEPQSPTNQLHQLYQLLLGRIFTYMKYIRIVFNFPLFIMSYSLFRNEVKGVLHNALRCTKWCKFRSDFSREMDEVGLCGSKTDYLTPVRIDCESES